MSKLRRHTRKVLKEDVSTDDVLNAVRNNQYVKIRYNDMSDVKSGKGSRTIAPMAVGTTKKGFPVVRAFQVGGSSRRGAPKWKFFRLDRIMSWNPMKKKRFFTPPDPSFGEYNTTGDKSMQHFIDNSKFGDMEDPLEKMRAQTQNIQNAPKIGGENRGNDTYASQQWKKNVFTSQPNSERYKAIAQNLKDTENDVDRFADWEKAEQEAQAQNEPQGFKDEYKDMDYDVSDEDFDENDFYNSNTKDRWR